MAEVIRSLGGVQSQKDTHDKVRAELVPKWQQNSPPHSFIVFGTENSMEAHIENKIRTQLSRSDHLIYTRVSRLHITANVQAKFPDMHRKSQYTTPTTPCA